MATYRYLRETSVVPVILCGGSGSRLWPLSRQAFPKQFLVLGDNEKSMLQETIERLKGLECLPPVIVTNEEHRFLVAEQMEQIKCDADILLEPEGRNTAPAITAAAVFIKRHYRCAHMLVLPSDHIIKDHSEFLIAISEAYRASKNGHLVTFGISPEHPETGYGYIHYGEALEDNECVRKVLKFVEKPDLNTAKQYIASKSYLWNSGMYMFRSDQLLAEMSKVEPLLVDSVSDAVQYAKMDNQFIALDRKAFTGARNISIDYALMERSSNAAVVPMDCGWSDAGAWDSLWRISKKDDNGNVVRGNTLLTDTKNSHIYSDSSAAIAALGMEDTIIVATNDVILVADRSHAQDVKKLITEAEKRGDGKLAKFHTRVYRPWGHYETIEMGTGHQVKHIEVKPKARLSVQSHNHRSEHWVIVNGKAKVRVGNRELIMTDNQYVYIPLGAVHCIENIGDDVLKFIEVQQGDYLGEDDIVRYDDIYGRVSKETAIQPVPLRAYNGNVIPMEKENIPLHAVMSEKPTISSGRL